MAGGDSYGASLAGSASSGAAQSGALDTGRGANFLSRSYGPGSVVFSPADVAVPGWVTAIALSIVAGLVVAAIVWLWRKP